MSKTVGSCETMTWKAAPHEKPEISWSERMSEIAPIWKKPKPSWMRPVSTQMLVSVSIGVKGR